MTITKAISEAYRLQRVWVGRDPDGLSYNLDAIHASITQELKFGKNDGGYRSIGNKRETHAEAIRLGKVRKTLGVR
jgi:hypothetical protein